MALKKFKFNLEFLVEINDFHADESNFFASGTSGAAVKSSENAERQKRLFAELVSNEKFVTNYVKQFFVDMLEVEARDLVQARLFADQSQAESDVLVEALEILPPEDRQFFEQCLDEQMFITDSTEFSLAEISMKEI